MDDFDKELEKVEKEVLENLDNLKFDEFISRIDEFLEKYTKLVRFD